MVNIHEVTSLWGHPVAGNIDRSLSLYHQDINRSARYQRRVDMGYLSGALPISGDRVPDQVANFPSPYEVEYLYQFLINDLYRRVPVIEIDGPRGAGKGSQVGLLQNYIEKHTAQKPLIAKVSGFIDSPEESEKYVGQYPHISSKNRESVLSFRISRWAQNIDLLHHQEEAYGDFKDRLADDVQVVLDPIVARYNDPEKPLIDVLSDVVGIDQYADRRFLGEYSWFTLQEILFEHLNAQYPSGGSVICDGGRVSRLQTHSRYDVPTALFESPFEITFPTPDSWINALHEKFKCGYSAQVQLPLPRMTVILHASRDELQRRAQDDRNKPDADREHRKESLTRNYDLFYYAAERYQQMFPDASIMVESGSIEETHEAIVSALKERDLIG